MPKQNARASGLRANRDGGIAVEFALVVPLLISLLLGTAQLGIVFLNYHTMSNAVADVSRQVAMGDMDSATVRSLLDTYLNPSSDNGSGDGNGGGDSEEEDKKFIIQVTENGDLIEMQISIESEDFAFLDVFGVFHGQALTVSSVARRIDADGS